MTVYVVTSGSYDTCMVRGVFSTRENAELWIGAQNRPGEEFEIGEWSLDLHVNAIRTGRKPFLVKLRRDGRVICCDPWDCTDDGNPEFFGETMHLILLALDRHEAVLIAGEVATRAISEGNWPEAKTT